MVKHNSIKILILNNAIAITINKITKSSFVIVNIGVITPLQKSVGTVDMSLVTNREFIFLK